MVTNSIHFVLSEAPSSWTFMPAMEEVFADAAAFPPYFLLPLLGVDGGNVFPAWEGIPLYVAHEVGVTEVLFHVTEDGKYELRQLDALEIPEASETQVLLEEYVEEEHGGLEELEDENAELFDDVPARAYLALCEEGGRSDVAVSIGSAQWIQLTEEPPPHIDDGFALALENHPHLFGRYYLFVDAEARTIRQVFQCT